jgi:tRNA-modifying protein YgfZ
MMTKSEFETMAAHVGLVDRSARVRLEITGPDRAKFLHNLTTNEVKRLAVGRGCEAFVTSPQGKTIGYMVIHAADDRLVARADPGGAELALPHFRKYGVFDDVSIDDVSSSTFELHLLGPEAIELARRAAGALPEDFEYAHIAAEIGGNAVRLVRESPSLPRGVTVIGELAAAAAVKQSLLEQGKKLGLIEIDAASFDLLRIEAGTPVFGSEVTDKNLPQEFGRDDRAINFVKGCYLGQETVARIDALGHVNQVMKGLYFEPGSPIPEPGVILEHDGKRVGVITSAAFSPVRESFVGLGMIRTTHSQPGSRLSFMSPQGTASALATVQDLPQIGSL